MNKAKIKEIIVIICAWLVAFALVFLVILKAKLLLNIK